MSSLPAPSKMSAPAETGIAGSASSSGLGCAAWLPSLVTTPRYDARHGMMMR